MKKACFLLLFLLPAALTFFPGCTLFSGSTFESLADADELTSEDDENGSDESNGFGEFSGESEETVESNSLKITSDPSGAEIYMDNLYMGYTPLELEDFKAGSYKLEILNTGYRTQTAWITYSGGDESYSYILEPITGYLSVKVTPSNAQIILDGEEISSGMNEVPIGTYLLNILAFGYEEYQTQVTIEEDLTSHVDTELPAAEFRLYDFSVSRRLFNPFNPGLLGKSHITFRVSAPGKGVIVILDDSGQEVYRKELPPFDTWDQSFLWNGKAGSGAVLDDGTYFIRLTAAAARDGTEKIVSDQIMLDSTLKIAYRSNWSGVPGLLYTGSPDVLPRGSFQIASLFMAHWQPIQDEMVYRAPIVLSFRYGLEDGMEIDLLAGLILEKAPSLPFFLSGGFRYRFAEWTSGSIELASSLSGKLTYHRGTGTDTLTNFTGFSAGIPSKAALGPVAVLFHPELIFSPWHVTYNLDYREASPAFWLYIRNGLLFDFRGFVTGISLSLRSTPFHEGFRFSGENPHFQAGVEAHIVLPNTQVFLSLVSAAEIESAEDWYVMGGGGLGFLY